MEGDDGGGVESEKNQTPEGEQRVKRKMKTPFQLEMLEKTYAAEPYPSEELRAELSVQLNLSDRQLQMWFCHRRLKDRKAPATKASPPSGPSGERVIPIADANIDSSPRLSLFADVPHQKQRVQHRAGSSVPRISNELLSSVRRYTEPPIEQRAIAFVQAQLGEVLREDGPILGMEFDPLPPGAFGEPFGHQKPNGRIYDAQLQERFDAKPIKSASKAVQEYQFLPEKPSLRNDPYKRSIMHGNEQLSSGYGVHGPTPSLSLLPHEVKTDHGSSPAPREVEIDPRMTQLVNVNIDTNYVIHTNNGSEDRIITPERRIVHDEMKLERKRKNEEARIAKEVEAHHKKLRKELERQDILRRKREEQMRKEMERQDRERQKEEERLLREKQREQEKYLKEQRREIERREKFLKKEYIRAEKMKLKEEMRRVKEAARLKAAKNRAAARRIYKESTDLMEDEKLELMEIAAKSTNLPSMLALDGETLQNLDLFKDKLPEFPPRSVNLKKPFSVEPWSDSEENVGNLLMVWRFLITFADVLGLWPFTLDEFTRAFHESDPRLLGEIHIALLKPIIKDIEDVARTPATASVANQYIPVIPGGGHPEIVEGAYAWGFDLLSWQRHLSPLTWPEILRQLALSAGFGPKLKNRIAVPAVIRNEEEVDDGADIISNLRSGLAAENAVSMMQERGNLSNPRKSRHCLTPGTVKFAAFHVLSLASSKGLSILEVAEKIQKSGLRDLTTSKTPEASISAALSRDTKLFERTAPSTYCVRSPYRKEPSDAEEILSAARDKIQAYFNRNLYGEEEEEADVEEKDEASGSDVPEDADDVDPAESKLKEDSQFSETRKRGDISIGAFGDQEDTVNDEFALGETWVQGLTEGEYADLSVEERLSALVALVGIANEGNTIRICLEERLEAANALKKQMWAEAQIDKRRIKEEQSLKLHHESSSTNPGPHLMDLNDHQNDQNSLTNAQMQQEFAAEKSRSELKSLYSQRAEEMYVYKSSPLGQDRRFNRYWQFIASPNEPGLGKIFVELCDGMWRIIDLEEGFDALLSSLDVRGIRESHLHSMLLKIQTSFKSTARKNLFPKKESKLDFQENDLIERHDDFEKWLRQKCFNSKKYETLRCQKLLDICSHCRLIFSTCEETFDFIEHANQCERRVREEGLPELSLPPRIRFLKAQLATIEASIPSEALESVWSDDYRKSWGAKLYMASTVEEILQILTLLENSMKRDFLSLNYETTFDLLRSFLSNLTKQPEESISVLPWIPQTSSAVALRLMELESSIYYTTQQKEDAQKDDATGGVITHQSRYSCLGNSIDDMAKIGNQDNWVDFVNERATSKRGRGRPRGPTITNGKSKRRAIESRQETTSNDQFALPIWKGRPRGRGGRKKGRPSNKSRGKKTAKISGEKVLDKSYDDGIDNNTPGKEWNLQETPTIEAVDAENGSSLEESEFDEQNEYDDLLVDDFSRSVDYRVGREEDEPGEVDVNYDDDEEGDDDDDDDVEHADYYVDGYFNSDYQEEGNQSDGGDRVGNVDRSSDRGSEESESSEFSY